MSARFLLFAGNDYYPKGGAYDFKGAFDTEEAAVLAHNPKEHTYNGGWANIFDIEAEKIVKQFYEGNWVDGDANLYF